MSPRESIVVTVDGQLLARLSSMASKLNAASEKNYVRVQDMVEAAIFSIVDTSPTPALDSFYNRSPWTRDDAMAWRMRCLENIPHLPGVYYLRCSARNAWYIGASKDMYARVSDHLRWIADGRHPVGDDAREYGLDSIETGVRVICPLSESLAREEARCLQEVSDCPSYNTDPAKRHNRWGRE
jgi:hypothetical protein